MREEGDRLEVRGFIRRSVVPCRGMSGGSCSISKIDQGKVWAHGMSAICMVGTAREWSSQLLMMVHGGEMKRRITKRQFAIAFHARLSICIEGFMSSALVSSGSLPMCSGASQPATRAFRNVKDTGSFFFFSAY